MRYRHLIMILALSTASCAYLQPADQSSPGNHSDSALASYDSRDETIEVTGGAEAAQPRLEGRILVLVNRERQTAGVGPLSFSPQLAKAAHQHSAAMAAEEFFEHRGANEPVLFDRITASGMETNHVGENIFETSEGVSGAVADECVQMWMQSEGHRMNMLSPEFEKTGISIEISRNGENYITEDFAH